MGNNRNSVNRHISRGKFKKRRASVMKNNGNAVKNMSTLTDSRIIKLQQLQEHIQTVTSHVASCPSCANKTSLQQMVSVKEKHREGLASILTTHCEGCHAEFPFPTSVKVKGMTGGQYWEINLAAVWGQMSTGGGHAPLEETMAVLGVPTMTKRSFIAAEKRIGTWWTALLEESMKLAGQEEREKAIARKSFFQGDPAITVILDGGWSKRSHKHSYNAKCGVGIIIGLETQKILFMGVRNKYCAVCNQFPNGDPPEHTCYKNWNGSSSAMETDIIVEGFKKCIQHHGIKYTKFIGDGDSSVYPTLISSVPWGYAIEKMECANHAVKCYRTALETLVQDKPHYRGRGKLTEAMRKRLTKAARCAIVMRSKESNKQAAIVKLQQDLLNGPLHCFGCHTNCSTDFCKTAQQSTSNTQNNSSVPTPESPSHISSVITPLPMSPTSPQSSTACLLANNSSPLPFDPIPPSLSTPQLSTTSTDCNIEPTIQQCADTTEGPSMITSDSLPSDDIPLSSLSTPQLSSTTTDCDITQQCANTTEDECAQDLIAITTGQNEHWIDATSDECLEEVRDVSPTSEGSLDLTMLCDIQRIVSRLVAKAPQLIGSVKTGFTYNIILHIIY